MGQGPVRLTENRHSRTNSRQTHRVNQVSDQNHTQPPRPEVLAIILTLVGFAGLALSVGGPGLWPSFSGERAYNAHLITSDAEAPAPTAPPQYSAVWGQAPSDELTLRVINETARSVCQSEARAARRVAEQIENARRAQRRPGKSSSCQSRPTLLTATVSGRPAES